MNPNIQHLPIGSLLDQGKYRIVRFIGAGGFGCTYEAEFVPIHSRVAIKEFFISSYCNRDSSGAISLGAASQAALVARLENKFREEAKRLFELKHSGIVSVTNILQENGTSYYVMDYIKGSSLHELIENEGPLTEVRALQYIGHVMEALEYMHGKSMLHLDIKPDNIMINTETDHAILIDFGVSKQYDEVDGHNTSTIMGQTPGFAPPEQGSYHIRQFTPASDIYALGATLYTALTGCIPPSSNDLISGDADLKPLPSTTTSATQKAIDLMMQPSVKKRPQTISDVRSLLNINPAPIEGIPTVTLCNDNRIRPIIPTSSGLTTATRNTQFKPRSDKWWLWIIWLWIILTAIVEILLPTTESWLVAHIVVFIFSVCSCVFFLERNKNINRLRKAAKKGDAEAQFNLAYCYFEGQGVTQNFYEAVKWLRKAAKQRHAMAQFYLAACYGAGEGIKQDSNEALKWLRKAAEQGFAQAQCSLGYCYDIGQGVAKDYNEAVKWYRKAAEQGDADAQEALDILLKSR